MAQADQRSDTASIWRNEVRGPDFLCIGAQKAGTRWLYDQLQWHPDFWMPPIKELHYFDGRFKKHFNLNYQGIYQSALTDLPGTNERREKQASRPLDGGDQDFLVRVKEMAESERPSFEQYLALFEMAGNRITGDITPAYSILDEKQISKIHESLPNLRIVFFVRHPVSRAWSHYCMLEKEGKTFPFAELTERKFRKFLNRNNVNARSFPSRTIQRWGRFYPDMKVCLFDDLRDNPDRSRRAILEYLGADADISDQPVARDFNRKSKNKKNPMPDAIRGMLEKHFSEEIAWCRRELGGAATKW